MSKSVHKTLASEEHRLRPASFAVIAMSDVACAWLLAQSLGQVPLPCWLPCALLAGTLCLANSYGFLGPGAAIGAIPVAIVALGPAALPGLVGLQGPLRACCGVLLVVSLAVTVFFCSWFSKLHAAYAHAAPIAGDAVLVVLGGYIVDGVPVQTVCRRLEIAARLWEESAERLVLVTGGPTVDGTTTEAEAMARWLEEHTAVPHEAILVEPQATDTEENLAFSQELLVAHGLGDRQVCIVSSDYHLYRALVIAHRLGMEATAAPSPVPLSSRLQQWSREVLVICSKGLARQ